MYCERTRKREVKLGPIEKGGKVKQTKIQFHCSEQTNKKLRTEILVSSLFLFYNNFEFCYPIIHIFCKEAKKQKNKRKQTK